MTNIAVPEPICRWDFQEHAGSPRAATGRENYRLEEVHGPIPRGDDGILGPHCAELAEGQWFRIPRASCPALNLRGADARLTISAWVRRAAKSNNECQAVAGMWNETDRTRQYCLFLNLCIWDSADQVCGHLSSTGAPSPGYKYCMEASIGKTAIPLADWHHIAFTYDGTWARVYLDGAFDARPGLNPYFWPCPINDGGEAGSDFTVGAVYRSGVMGNWFVGSLGGLAVYDTALSTEQVAALHATRNV